MTAPVSPSSAAVMTIAPAPTIVVPIKLVLVPRRPLTPASLPWATA